MRLLLLALAFAAVSPAGLGQSGSTTGALPSDTLLTATPLYTGSSGDPLLVAYARFGGADAFGLAVINARRLAGSEPVIRFYTDEDGTWTESVIDVPAMPSIRSLRAVDYDRDGRQDLVTAQDDEIFLYRDTGEGLAPEFSAPEVLLTAVRDVDDLLLLDLNGDGYLDLVYLADYVVPGTGHVRTSLFSALNNRGHGALPRPDPIIEPTYSHLKLLGADFNGDGNADVLTSRASGPDRYTFLQGDGAGGFAATHVVGSYGLTAPTWFDFDGDGADELLTIDDSDGALALQGLAVDETFGLAPAWELPLNTVSARPGYSYRFQPTDVVGDGAPELLLTAVSTGSPYHAHRTVLVRDGDVLHVVNEDSTSLRSDAPFARSASGAYFRANWDYDFYVDPQSVYAERVLPDDAPVPPPPAGVAAMAGGPGSATLSWEPPAGGAPDGGPLRYHVEVERTDGGYRFDSEYVEHLGYAADRPHRFWDYGLNATARTSWTFRNLPIGDYVARVRAVTAAGHSSVPSAPAAFAVNEGQLPEPPDVTAEPTDGAIALGLYPGFLTDSLRISRRVPGGTFASLATVAGGRARYVDRVVEPGATYEYVAAAYLDGSESAPSPVATATAPELPLLAVPLPDPDYRVRKAIPYDLDQDGHEDLVVWASHTASGAHRVYRIPGTDNGLDPSAGAVVVEGTPISDLFVGDWNGDTFPDLVATSNVVGGAVRALIWTLDGTAPTGEHAFDLPSGELSYGRLKGVADLDLDGRADLLLDPASGFDDVLVVAWSEPGDTVTIAPGFEGGDLTARSALVDFDQDGLLDVLLTAYPTADAYALRNGGDRSFSTVDVGLGADPDLIYDSFLPLWLNDDPYPDLLIGRYIVTTGALVRDLFEFDPVTETYAPHPLEIEADGVVRPSHLDADGFTDFVEVFGSTLRLWLNDENATLTPVSYPLTPGSIFLDLAQTDVDGDGDLDALLTLSDRAELLAIANAAELPPAPPATPRGLAASGDAAELVLSWEEVESAWARPGHIAYGLVLTSASDTLIVGEVTPALGTPRAAAAEQGLHRTEFRLLDVEPGAYTVAVTALDPAGRASGFSAPVAFTVSPVGVDGQALPHRNALSAAYPNPTRATAQLDLELGEAEDDVRVEVYDVLGRRVAVLHDGPLAAGEYRLTLDGTSLPAGVYVVRATGAGLDLTRRVTLIR